MALSETKRAASISPNRSLTGSSSKLPTRRAVELAAAKQFRRDGFAATTVRGIAAEAGVNPALVIRHFGSKEALFLDVMTLVASGDRPDGDAGGEHAADPQRSALSRAMEGPLNQLGRRLVAYVLDEVSTDQPEARDVYVALARAVDIPEVRDRLRDVVRQQLVQPLTVRLYGPQADSAAALVAVQLAGLMAAVWGVEDNLLQALSKDLIVELYGGALQHVIDTAAPV